MERSRVVETLREVLAQHPGVDAEGLSDGSRLLDIGVDSLTMLEVLYDVEQRFGASLDLEAVAKFETAGDLIDHLATIASAGD